MKFRPLHDRIVIKRIEAEARTATDITIPDTARDRPQQRWFWDKFSRQREHGK
jgi:chaperonin GroES